MAIKLPRHQIHLKTLLSKHPPMLSQTCKPHPKRSLKCWSIGRRQEHLPVLMGIEVITRNSLVGCLDSGCVVLFLINSPVDRFVNIFSLFLDNNLGAHCGRMNCLVSYYKFIRHLNNEWKMRSSINIEKRPMYRSYLLIYCS